MTVFMKKIYQFKSAFTAIPLLAMAMLLSGMAGVNANDLLLAGEGEYRTRALIRSMQKVEYRSEILAPVAEIGFLLGERFSKDDPLVVFDCSRTRLCLRPACFNGGEGSKCRGGFVLRQTGLDWPSGFSWRAHHAFG